MDKDSGAGPKTGQNRGRSGVEKPSLAPKSKLCMCADCEEYFYSPGAFDRHLLGTGTANPRCRTHSQMEKMGMTLNERGIWLYGVSKGEAKEGT